MMAQQQQVAHVIQEYQSPTTQSSSRAAEREQVSISSKKDDAYLRYYWYYLVPTLYTVPSNSRAIVKSLLVSNDAGSAATITATLTDAASAVFSLFKVKSIASNTTEQLLTEPLILLENEILKVTASDANELHVVASLLEINRD